MVGVGHQLGAEHDSTPRSGVEAPRLLKNGASPDCIVVVVVVCCCVLFVACWLCVVVWCGGMCWVVVSVRWVCGGFVVGLW